MSRRKFVGPGGIRRRNRRPVKKPVWMSKVRNSEQSKIPPSVKIVSKNRRPPERHDVGVVQIKVLGSNSNVAQVEEIFYKPRISIKPSKPLHWEEIGHIVEYLHSSEIFFKLLSLSREGKKYFEGTGSRHARNVEFRLFCDTFNKELKKSSEKLMKRLSQKYIRILFIRFRSPEQINCFEFLQYLTQVRSITFGEFFTLRDSDLKFLPRCLEILKIYTRPNLRDLRLSEVKLTGKFLKMIDLPNLKSLFLGNLYRKIEESYERITEFTALPSLEHLECYVNIFDIAKLSAVYGPTLKIVNVFGEWDKFGENEHMSFFKNLIVVEKLKIGGTFLPSWSVIAKGVGKTLKILTINAKYIDTSARTLRNRRKYDKLGPPSLDEALMRAGEMFEKCFWELTELHINNAQKFDLSKFVRLDYMPKLKTLTFYSGSFRQNHCFKGVVVPNLEELSVRSLGFWGTDIDQLSPTLKKLKITGPPGGYSYGSEISNFTTYREKEEFHTFQNLEILYLERCDFREQGVQNLPISLKTLCLRYMKCGLFGLHRLRNLTSLHLYQFKNLHPLCFSGLISLQSLRFSECQMNYRKLREIDNEIELAANLPSLKIVSIARNQLPIDKIFVKCSTIERFTCRSPNNFDGGCLVSSRRTLRRLELRCTKKVSDNSVEELAKLTYFKADDVENFSFSCIPKLESLEELSIRFALPKKVTISNYSLRVITLGGKFSGVEFGKLPNIQTIRFCCEECKIDCFILTNIKKRFPNVNIELKKRYVLCYDM